MSRKLVSFAAAALALSMAGCLVGSNTRVRQEGTYVSESALQSIEPGKTTAAWVRATLGSPDERTEVERGHEVWKYTYKETRDSDTFIFLIFAGSDHKTKDGAAFVEIKDGVVTKTWRS
jgi:outer membrane protein assembly factor BamE (lipoprotein component of BamABCDE complex)